MTKIYGIVKGQCSHSLKTVLKQEGGFNEKDKEQDILWLLERPKEITSRLDMKSNKRCNLFNAMLDFCDHEARRKGRRQLVFEAFQD